MVVVVGTGKCLPHHVADSAAPRVAHHVQAVVVLKATISTAVKSKATMAKHLKVENDQQIMATSTLRWL